ncbi:hypothetical protein [uncultured Arthrobacter sp.]|uniref:hypothetical protein n=1 Tax=uncultured Arthrobacter sp. TaxID=114050 RepID=UPI0028D844A8|nr:hypothetical protein [uncultured Arthrobacter sp.]
MGNQEKWFRVVEQERSGLFGMGRKSTYELLGDDRRFTTRALLAELLGPNQDARRDAYECIDRANNIFPNGRRESVGYPSGAKRTDPLATDMEAVTLDMLTFGTLLRLVRLPELAREYESLAMELRTDGSAQAVEKARKWVLSTLQSGPGRLDDRYIQKLDGSVDRSLSDWYDALRDRLGGFAGGTLGVTGGK